MYGPQIEDIVSSSVLCTLRRIPSKMEPILCISVNNATGYASFQVSFAVTFLLHPAFSPSNILFLFSIIQFPHKSWTDFLLFFFRICLHMYLCNDFSIFEQKQSVTIFHCKIGIVHCDKTGLISISDYGPDFL